MDILALFESIFISFLCNLYSPANSKFPIFFTRSQYIASKNKKISKEFQDTPIDRTLKKLLLLRPKYIREAKILKRRDLLAPQK
jgi:hypothetical protein